MIMEFQLVMESHVAKKKSELVFSDWADGFVTILVRKVSGPHIKKVEITKKKVSGWVRICFNNFV